MKESIKFGDDVKYLAEFTSGMKKFEPWITKAEAKKGQGMPKPMNLEEAQDYLAYSKVSSAATVGKFENFSAFQIFFVNLIFKCYCL